MNLFLSIRFLEKMSTDELLNRQVADWRYILRFTDRIGLVRKTDDELKQMLERNENSFGYNLYNTLGLPFLRNYSLRTEAIKYHLRVRKMREEKDRKENSKRTKQTK